MRDAHGDSLSGRALGNRVTGLRLRCTGQSHQLPALKVTLFVAFLLRVSTLEAQGLWRDEVDQWRFAFQSWRELLGNFSRAGWNGPLYSPLLRAWMLIAGESVYAMRLLSVFWGVLSVALLASLAHRIAGKRVSLAAGLLAAVSPYMIWYAQEIKMYTWVPMLVLLALYALDRACPTSRWEWWLVVFAATTTAIYSHILAALLIPVLVLWFLLHPQRDRSALVGGGIVLAALTLPYLPLLAWQWPLLWESRQTGYPDLTLGEMSLALLNGWGVGISQGAWGLPTVTTAISAALVGLATLGLGLLIRRRGWGRGLQIALWLGFPLLAVWLVSRRSPIFTDRYLIWALPAFLLLVSGGIVVLRRALRSVAALIFAGLVTIAIHGWIVQGQVPIKPQFNEAVTVVESQRESGDLLMFQIPYNQAVFAFYASRELDPWVEAPYTNWRVTDGSYLVDEATIGRELRGLVAGYDRVWLVYSEAQLWDDRELVKGWFMTHYELTQATDLHGVSLLLFARSSR